jgi:hypothetical protein
MPEKQAISNKNCDSLRFYQNGGLITDEKELCYR